MGGRRRRYAAAGDAHYIGTGDGFGRVALVVLQFAVDDHIGTHGYLRVAFYPGSAVVVLHAVAGELGGRFGTVVGEVEGSGAVFGVEGEFHGRNFTLHIEGTYLLEVGVGGPGEILHGSHGCGHVVRIGLGAVAGRSAGATALAATVGSAIEAVDIAGTLANRLGRVALVVHDGAVDNDDIVYLDLGVAGLPLTVAQVVGLIHLEGAGTIGLVHDGEGGIAIGAAGLEGSGNLGNLTLDVNGLGLVVIVLVGPGEVSNGSCSSGRIVRIFQRTGALGGTVSGIAGVYTATVHAIETVDEGCALAHGLGGITFIIIDCTVDDDFVLFLDVGVVVRLGPLHIAQIVGLVHLEDLGGAFFVNNVEGSVAVGAAGLVGGLHRGDDTLHEDLLGALDIGPQSLHVLDGAGHGERIVQGTVSVVYHTLRAHLADGEGLTGKADGEDDGSAAVVALVLGDRDGELLTVGIGGAGLLGEGDPVRKAGYGPVAGGDKADILGGDLGLKAYVRGIHGELGGTQVHFFLVTGHEHGCSGQDCQKEFSKFHIQLLLCF